MAHSLMQFANNLVHQQDFAEEHFKERILRNVFLKVGPKIYYFPTKNNLIS